jgi:DUF1365 family protein
MKSKPNNDAIKYKVFMRLIDSNKIKHIENLELFKKIQFCFELMEMFCKDYVYTTDKKLFNDLDTFVLAINYYKAL